jgi:hypothetical protein
MHRRDLFTFLGALAVWPYGVRASNDLQRRRHRKRETGGTLDSLSPRLKRKIHKN